MKRRCNKQNDSHFKWYGGRGIKVCLEWQNNFKSFYDWCIENGWEKGLSVDRTDNDRGYSPENCTIMTRSLNSKKRNDNSPNRHSGILNPNAKLNAETINKLRDDLNNNFKIKELSVTYKISIAHIYRIKNNERWNSVSL